MLWACQGHIQWGGVMGIEGKAVAAPDAYAPTMIDYTYLADTTMGNGVCQNCTPELGVRCV